jgi:hypothetical protein
MRGEGFALSPPPRRQSHRPPRCLDARHRETGEQSLASAPPPSSLVERPGEPTVQIDMYSVSMC